MIIEAIEGIILITKCNPKEAALARNIQCRTWDRKSLGWRFPCRPDVLRELSATFNVPIPDAARVIAQEIEVREQGVKEAKLAGWERSEAVEPMPIKVKPFQHQVLAFNVCMELLGI